MWLDAVPNLTDEILNFTEGKRLVIIGGAWSGKEDIAILKKVFELQELDWIISDKGGMKRYESACARIENGQYDIVISLVLASSHEAFYRAKAAAKKTETHFFALNRSVTPQSLAALFGEYLKRPARAYAKT